MIVYVIIFGVAFATGVMCQAHIGKAQNLTKEEYSLCVQMILSDYGGGNTSVQHLLDEISTYAVNEKAVFEHLSLEARNIVNRVQTVLD